MIEVRGLTKKYGKTCAVDHVDFTIRDGEIVGFLGPNGAGKSTTMNMITGYISATEGDILIDGIHILDDPMKARRKIGYLPEQPPLYMDMTVAEYLNFVFELKAVKKERQAHLDEICRMTKLEDVQNRIIKNLSKGYRQRVGVAQALVGDPDVLILDEPTVGLDPQQIIDIRNMISELGKERTIILSSHILPEVQAVCERILVLSDGKIAADGTPEELAAAMTGGRQILLRVLGDRAQTEGVLRQVQGVAQVNVGGKHEERAEDYQITCMPGTDPREAVFYALAKANLPILMMKSADMTLEDIFLKLVTKDEKTQEKAEEREEIDAAKDREARI